MKSVPLKKKIFVSYRKQDTAGETGRLVDSLRDRFGDDQLFLDVESLEPGADFSEVIEKSLDSCDVFLAVIGPNWIGSRNGQPRIMDPNDWVRTELSTALRRNIRVVPVLVNGGTLPKAEELPENLQKLLARQTTELSNNRWRYDTDQLLDFLEKKMGFVPKRIATSLAAVQAPTKRKVWPYVVGGFAACIVFLVIIASLMDDAPKTKDASTTVNNASGTEQQNVPSPANNNGEAKEALAAESPIDVTGSWLEDDPEMKSTFVLKQNGKTVDVSLQASGMELGNGTGVVSGREVALTVPISGVTTIVNLTLSDDGQTLNGTYKIQNTVERIKLVKL